MSKKSIWDRLGRFGFSDPARAAIMGNIGPESGYDPYNVEDRFKGDDHAYVAAVDNGSYSLTDFMYDRGQYYGFGLCQWTFSTRKQGLYILAKGRGVSIADEDMQLDYMWQELQTPEFSDVLAVLRSDASLREMAEKFMVDFERPADKSQAAKNYRVGIAEKILNEFAGSQPAEKPADTPDTPFWPPRTLCFGMVGADVRLLQSSLMCHGYDTKGCGGTFDARTKNMTMAFQSENNLDVDGIAGPKTFGALGVTV